MIIYIKINILSEDWREQKIQRKLFYKIKFNKISTYEYSICALFLSRFV